MLSYFSCKVQRLHKSWNILLSTDLFICPSRISVHVALCVRAQLRHYNNNASHEGSCALWRTAAAPQFAIGRRKALQSAKRSQLKRLQTQKDGCILATDVWDSLEIQWVEKKEQSLQRSHGSSAIHDQETGQVHQVVSDPHIVSFYLCIYCTIL